MKQNILLILFFTPFFFTQCGSETDKPTETTAPSATNGSEKVQTAETKQMADELRSLLANGDPKIYFNWNHERAALYKTELETVAPENFNQIFYSYCSELLFAGENRQCINELEAFLNEMGKPYEEIMSDKYYPVFELLALAYLRLGEEENCQNSHTAFSCIIPLHEPAVHQLEEGSRKAIELYTLIQKHRPQDKYKWLINIAYMTLGEYPDKVPADQKIIYPNWKMEQKNFPRFEEIAMNVGLAENGLSGGVCVEDFNQDGLLDVFATSSQMRDQAKLFFNNGKGSYEDVTVKAGLQGLTGGLNCTHADYNNDGFEDILILRGGWLHDAGRHPNSLLRNNGDGTFDDVTRSAGILSYFTTQTAAWADFNKDGFLDLFIGNESETSAQPCELYKNNGNGTFTEVSAAHGLGGITKFVKGVAWGDINNDTWPDLYISDARGMNLLYKNNGGQFEEIGKKAGVQEPYHSFPCWFFDANNDGFQDIFVCGYDLTDLFALGGDYAAELQGKVVKTDKPRLYINNGDETFTDKTVAYAISKTMYGMGSNFGDLDNDGFLDFYIGTGSPEYSTLVPNRMFRNVGGKKFEEVTSAGGFGHIQKGHGVSFSDMDQDGDQDVYAVMGGAYEGDDFTNVLFENPGFGNNWFVLELVGVKTNRNAIGTRLEIELNDGKKLYRVIGTGGSFGASSMHEEIGMGKATEIKKLTIYWQNSEKQEFTQLKANQKVRITEGKATVETVTYKYIAFAKASGAHKHQH
jgi:hypothetical protein